MSIQKALYNHLTGISPIMAEEICHLASIDSDYGASELSETELLHLYHTFSLVMEDVKDKGVLLLPLFLMKKARQNMLPCP